MLKSAAALLGCAALASAALTHADIPDYSSYTFESYIAEFGKVYHSNAVRVAREAQFYANLATIKAHNARFPHVTYYMKVNKFADLDTTLEMARYKGYSKRMASTSTAAVQAAAHTAPKTIAASDLPASVDWRTKGAVTAVKDQGGCGSCWAFSATESIESALFLSSGQLLTLAPQNTLECTPNPNHCGGTGGCEGAIAELAFQWAQGGIALETTVPYQGADAPCDPTVAKAAKTGGFVKLPENDPNALLTAIAQVGPISISVDASAWSFYGGGIFNGCNAAAPDIDHAVQAVGYGTDAGQDYWLVRNSWSAGWGEAGYIRLYRGAQETCGTDSTPGDGSGCTGGPTTVKVCGTCGIWYDNSYPTNVTLF